MQHIALLSTTGIEPIDQSIRAIVEHLEQHFPDRVRGYYLVGSFAVGEAIPTSDIDMIVLFKGSPSDEERQRFEQAREECRRLSVRPIDLTLGSEASFTRVGGVWFQTASRLLYGEDIRAAVPRKPVADHTRHLMHSMYPLLARVRDDPPRLLVPLDYPDPAGEFYGYDRRRMRGADGELRASTKNLVLNVICAASALTLLAAGQYVGSGRKSDIAEQYRIWVGDEWAAVVGAIYERCRNRWAYLVPEGAADRQQLRTFCQQCLGFENHFLARYQAFLLAELAHPDEAIALVAARRLGQVVYRDTAVVAALQAAGKRGSEELRQAAAEALQLVYCSSVNVAFCSRGPQMTTDPRTRDDLLDAMNRHACPLCVLVERIERKAVDMFLYDQVNDISRRDALRGQPRALPLPHRPAVRGAQRAGHRDPQPRHPAGHDRRAGVGRPRRHQPARQAARQAGHRRGRAARHQDRPAGRLPHVRRAAAHRGAADRRAAEQLRRRGLRCRLRRLRRALPRAPGRHAARGRRGHRPRAGRAPGGGLAPAGGRARRVHPQARLPLPGRDPRHRARCLAASAAAQQRVV